MRFFRSGPIRAHALLNFLNGDETVRIQTLLGIAIIGAAFAVKPASAATYLTESFAFTGSVYSAAGKFTYDQTTGHLQSITGNVATAGMTEAITGLVTGSSPFFPDAGNVRGFFFDNVFDPATKTLPLNGILFAFGSANYGNFYYNPTPFFSTWLPDGPTSPLDCSAGDLYCPGDGGRLSFEAVSPVPELSSWVMMLIGFLGVGIVGRIACRSRETRGRISAALV